MNRLKKVLQYVAHLHTLHLLHSFSNKPNMPQLFQYSTDLLIYRILHIDVSFHRSLIQLQHDNTVDMRGIARERSCCTEAHILKFVQYIQKLKYFYSHSFIAKRGSVTNLHHIRYYFWNALRIMQ